MTRVMCSWGCSVFTGGASWVAGGRFCHLHQSVSRLWTPPADGSSLSLPLHSEHHLWSKRWKSSAPVDDDSLFRWTHHEGFWFFQSRLAWRMNLRGIPSSWISTGTWRSRSKNRTRVNKLQPSPLSLHHHHHSVCLMFPICFIHRF